MYTRKSTVGLSERQWLRLRKTGIGGSDAGAVCGLNPYASPMAVFQDKTTDTVESQDNEAMRQGRDLEEYVARRFMEATGLKVRRSNCMYRSVEYPWMIADVDRLIVGEDAGLECKTASAYSADKWKNGEIPAHYLIQCYHYMAVTGKRAWYIAVAILGKEFKYARIEWEDEIIQKGIRFITPEYRELFRIPDGGKIRYQLPDGRYLDEVCRYIDETHMEVGRRLYHICEFAELVERAGITVTPLECGEEVSAGA